MKRLKNLENHGWRVIFYMCGTGCQASKNNGLTKISASSVTALHKKIFGY